jgi:glycosyltransferase involved in cell wall biosynthesis
MNVKLISIVIPVYNSESTLSELLERLTQVNSNLKYNFQIILIDDGSTDQSWNKIENLFTKYPTITALRLTKNFGQQAALLAGFKFCKGELIITMDDDLQHPPEEIIKLVSKFEETKASVVYGLPSNKQHSAIRNASSKAVTLTSANGNHQGSSFRLIKREIIEKIILNHQYNFLFIDALLNWYTSDFTTVEVEHHPRKAGKSGYTFRKLFSIHFKTMINYSVLPLKLLIYGGILTSIISFFIGTFFIWKKLMFDVPLGYTSIIVAILFSSGLIFLGIGFLGLYIHKIYEFNLNKPVYFVNKILTLSNDN